MTYRNRTVKPSTALWLFVAVANVVLLAFTAGLWLVLAAAVVAGCVLGLRSGRLFRGSPVGYPRPAPVRAPAPPVAARRR